MNSFLNLHSTLPDIIGEIVIDFAAFWTNGADSVQIATPKEFSKLTTSFNGPPFREICGTCDESGQIVVYAGIVEVWCVSWVLELANAWESAEPGKNKKLNFGRDAGLLPNQSTDFLR